MNSNLLSQKRLITSLLLVLVLMFNATEKTFAQLPPHFYDLTIISGMVKVEGVVFDHLHRMYAWEKSGKIWIIDSNGYKHPIPLLNISEEVGNWVDHGLNGVVLDPDYKHNGFIYVNYTVDRHYLLYYGTSKYNKDSNEYFNATIARVTRYTVDVANNFNSIVPNSRKIIIGETKQTGIPVTHKSHGSCAMAFGDDGTLIIVTGDGAAYGTMDNGSSNLTYTQQALIDSIIRPDENVGAFRSQMITSMNGKILRIDPVTGNGISSNPYYDASNPSSAKSRVWCLGLRNPYTMSIRPGSGSTNPADGKPGVVYIGMVGWALWESVLIADKPTLNFGWPLFEGLSYNASYKNALTPNYLAPNPLYGIGGCTQQYFYFQDLLIQETLDTTNLFRNPCDNTQKIPDSIYTFMHCRQIIDYRHGYDSVMVATFDGTEAKSIMVSDPASPCKGDGEFDGDCVIGGEFYTGTAFPAKYRNQYYFGEYEDGWICRLRVDSNNKPTNIDILADSVGAVTHVAMNPNDGSLVYVSYPNRIGKICYGCVADQPPVAIALADTTTGVDSVKVHFDAGKSYDADHSPLAYLWQFGNYATSTKVNPVKTFTAPHNVEKTVRVILTVTDDSSHASKDTIFIKLNNNTPVVKITSPANGSFYSNIYSQSFSYTASVSDALHSNNQLHYVWHTTLYTDGVATSPIPEDTMHSVVVLLDPTGCNHLFYYEVSLTVTDPDGKTGSDTVRLYPTCPPPVSNFTLASTTGCRTKPILFTNTSTDAYQYQWFFPGGTPSASTDLNPSVTYNTTGIYSITLIATNQYGLKDTLVRNNYLEITTSPIVSLNYSGNDSVCPTEPVMVSAFAAGNVTYQWFKNAQLLSGEANDTLYGISTGTYKVLVTNQSGCTTAKLKTLYAKSISVSTSASVPPPYCYGSNFYLNTQNANQFNSFVWKKNGVTIPGANSNSLLVDKDGNYQVSVSTQYGCKAISPITNVDFLPNVVVNYSGSLDFCAGDSVVFTATQFGGYTFKWKNNGVNIPGATTNTYTAKTAGKYSVQVQAPQGCSASNAKFNVTVGCRTKGNYSDDLTDISIVPNPVMDEATINFNLFNAKNISIDLFDVAGRKINLIDARNFSEGLNHTQVDFKELQSGTYFIKFFAEGELIGNVKFVKM